MAKVNSVGARIRAARKARGLTQAELGRGVATKGFISQVERDRATPSLAKLSLLASRLGLALDDLVGEGHALDLTYLMKSAELAVRAGEPARGLELAEEALAQAASARDRANLHRTRGVALDAMARWEQALVAHQAAAAAAPAEDHELNAEIWVEVGTVLQLLERFNAANEANLRALSWLDQSKYPDPSLRSRLLLNLSANAFTLGQLDGSIAYAQEALAAATDAESPLRIANGHMALGVVAREAGQLDLAIEHCNRALEIHRRISHAQVANRILNNIGDVHFAAGRRQEARQCQAQSLERARQLHDHFQVSVTSAELARYALLEGQLEEALSYARDSSTAARVAKDHVREAAALAYEGTAVNRLGNSRNADRLFRESFRLLLERDALIKLAHVCTVYSDVLRERGEVDRAFAFLRMASERDFKNLARLAKLER